MTHLFLTILVVLLMPVSSFASADMGVSEDAIRKLVVESPDSVLHILDRIESSPTKDLKPYQISLLRALAYNEKRMFSLVERYANETLVNDSIHNHPKDKLNALTLIAAAKGYYGDLPGCISASTEAIDLARQIGNVAAEYNVLTTMAKTSFSLGERKQGYDYLNQIISSGENAEDARVLANVSAAYGVKIVELYTDNQFSKGLDEGKKRLEIIEKIEKVGGAPAGFTDQQRAYSYARIASCAERNGNKKEALDAFNSFMATDYAKSPLGRAYIMDYLLDSGNWNKVLEFTKPLYPILSEGDTINGDYQSLLTSDARAYAGLGDFKRAYGLSNRANAIGDSLTLRENSLRSQELATIFALNEKDLELERTKASLQRKHILLISAFSVGILVVLILFLLIRAYIVSLKRQKLATKRIDELVAAYDIRYDEQDEDFSVFTEMQRKITSDKLFIQPNFNREGIMQATGLTRTRVVNLIDKYTGLTPNEYINKLRVEYSVKLIQEHPEWTIDAVAEECGYGRRGTYYTHFTKVFGITPAQYRKEKNIQSKQTIDEDKED